MDHRLVHALEKAFGWSGPSDLGGDFTRGVLPDPSLCSRLLTPTRLLDLVMRRSLSSVRARVLRDGVDLHPHGYIRPSTTRRAESVPMVDMRRLGLLLKSGCTLILDAVNTYDPTLEVACRALQWWSRELVQVNTYLTTGDAAGFELHWDDHDVIIVQLAGEKSWEVRGLSRQAPMYRDSEPNFEPSADVVWAGTLSSGEAMHIPRGFWHQATRVDRGDGFSLHVTFGLPKRKGVDWLSWLVDRAREEELFRHDLERFTSSDIRQAKQDQLVAAALELVQSRSVEEFLVSREQEGVSARHVATHGLFGKPASVVCVTNFPPVVKESGETVAVSAAGRSIGFTRVATRALRLLLSGHPVSIAKVSSACGVNVQELADVLVEEEVCAEVTDELASGYVGLTSEGL